MMFDTTYPPEPEETVEAALVSLLAPHATLPVEGVLTPASAGTVKNLSVDSFISVAVDQASHDLDVRGPSIPVTLSARVTVHLAQGDDASGTTFRDECRRVRCVLDSLTGDGCDAITTASSNAFLCDGFLPSTTQTAFEAGNNPILSKSYAVTIRGRVDTTHTQAADADE